MNFSNMVERKIMFGDITFADFIDERGVIINSDGERVVPILMRPSPNLIRVAQIDKDELNSEIDKDYGKKPRRTVWKEYPQMYIHLPRLDWLFIDTTFNRKPTDFTDRLEGVDKHIMVLERKISNQDEIIINLNEEVNVLTAQRLEKEKQDRAIRDVREGKAKTDDEGEVEDAKT